MPGRTATTKAISANAIRRNGGTVAFINNSSLGTLITANVSGSKLRDKARGQNYPNTSTNGNSSAGGTFAYIGVGQYIMCGFSTKINGTAGSIFHSGRTGTDTHRMYHNSSAQYTRVIGSWDYKTGAAQTVSVVLDDFGRDDAVARGTNNGEVTFIASGGRLKAQAAGNSKYYTYSKLY
jgi:hypothetical protein